MIKLLTKPLRKVTKLKETVRILFQAKSFHGLGLIKGFQRLKWLQDHHGYMRIEAFRCGLLNPDLQKEQFNRFISRKHLLDIQSKISPPELNSLVYNKALFYLYTSKLGFKTPRVLGIFWSQACGLDEHGKLLSERSQWMEYIKNEFPTEFVTKASGAHYGSSVYVYRRVDNGFMNLSNRKTYDANQLYRELQAQAGTNSIVIQERVYNHPSIIEFSANSALQTVRILTYIDRNAQFKILYAIMRPVATDEVVDNHNNFNGGILLARVDIETGRIIRTHFLRPDIPGSSIIEKHPVTQKPFNEFHIPEWDSAVSKIRDAAMKMLPMRLIGWDLAITPDGPVIIEGNASFNTNYLYDDAKEILFADLLASGHPVPHSMDPAPWIKN